MLQKTVIKHVVYGKKEDILDKFSQEYPDVYETNQEMVSKFLDLLFNCSETELSLYTSKKFDSIRNHAHTLQTITEEYKSLNITNILNQRLKESNKSISLFGSILSNGNHSDLQLDELEARSVLNRTQFYYNRTQELYSKCKAKATQIKLCIKFLKIIPETSFTKSQLELLEHGDLEIGLLINQIQQTSDTLRTVLDSTDSFINVNLPLVSKVRGLKTDIVNINGTLATSYFTDENISVLENLNKITKSRIQDFRNYNYFQQLQDIFKICNKQVGFFKSLIGKKDENSSIALSKTIELEQKISYFSNDLNKLLDNSLRRKESVIRILEDIDDNHIGRDALLGLINKSEQLITELQLILVDINSVKEEINILKQTIIHKKRA